MTIDTSNVGLGANPLDMFNQAATTLQNTKDQTVQNLQTILSTDNISVSPLDNTVKIKGDIEAGLNPYDPVLVPPSNLTPNEMSLVLTALENINAAEAATKAVAGNAWLASNPFVLLRQMVFEVTALISKTKAAEAKCERNAMNAVFDQAIVKAGLIMEAARVEAIQLIISAAINIANATMCVAMMHQSLKSDDYANNAASPEQMDKSITSAQNKRTTYQEKMDNTPGFEPGTPGRKSIDDHDKSIAENNTQIKEKQVEIRKQQEKKTADSEDNIKQLEKDIAGLEAKNKGHKEAIEAETKNVNHGKEFYKSHEKRDYYSQREEQLKNDKNLMSTDPQFKSQWVQNKRQELNTTNQMFMQAFQGYTSALDNITKAITTIEKSYYEAMQQYADAAQTIARQMMSNASEDLGKQDQLFNDFVNALTQAVSANMTRNLSNR